MTDLGTFPLTINKNVRQGEGSAADSNPYLEKALRLHFVALSVTQFLGSWPVFSALSVFKKNVLKLRVTYDRSRILSTDHK